MAAERWVLALDDADYEAIMAAIKLLEEHGPPPNTYVRKDCADMADTRHLKDIPKRRPLAPEARERVDAIKRAMRLEIALSELREMRGVSQSAVAAELETSRPNVSRIEKEVDVRLSTLERYVEALGGKLEIHAVFDDEDVKLSA